MTTLNTINAIAAPSYTSVSTIENEYDYRQVVLNLVYSVVSGINEALESGDCEFEYDSIEDFVNDELLHSVVDGSEFAIYNHYHMPIIMQSSNDEYYIDNFGTESAGEVLKQSGLSGLHSSIAFFAMYADVKEELRDLLNEVDFDIDEDGE